MILISKDWNINEHYLLTLKEEQKTINLCTN